MADNSTDFEEGAVADRVRELCQRGLERFREGDVAGALLDWDRARMLDSEAFLPRSYIERAAHGLDPESGDVPSGIELPLGAPPDSGEAPAVRPAAAAAAAASLEEEEEDDDYLELELTSGEPEPHVTEATVDVAKRRFVEAALDLFQLDDVDAGWSIDAEEGAALPPPPSEARAPSSDLGEVAAGVMGVPDDMLLADNDAEPNLDDLPVPEPARLGGETLDMPEESDEYRELATRELARPPELGPVPVHDSDSEITVPGGAESEVDAGLSLSDDALEALGGVEPEGAPAHEDTTVERPGVVKRGFALPDLDDLFGETRRDDRHDTEGDHGLSFREGTEDGLDQELTTERPSFRGDTQELTLERNAIGALDDELTTERPAMHDRGIELPALDDLFDGSDESAGPPAVIVEPGLLDEGEPPGVIHDPAGPGAPEPLAAYRERQVGERVRDPPRAGVRNPAGDHR